MPAYEDKMYGHLKTDVADAVVAMLEPIQAKFTELRQDQAELDRIMAVGAEKAQMRAQQTIDKVYEAIGFVASPLKR